MTVFTSTTPLSVFKTPIPHFDAEAQAVIPADLLASLTAFDACLALVSRSIAANADVAGWFGEPALSSFWAHAADAEASADMALEAFCNQPGCDPDLRTAAWLLLLLLADDGRDLEMVSLRSQTLRLDALACVSVPLPGYSYKSGRMWIAADLIDQLIDVARDEMGNGAMHTDGLCCVGVPPVRVDIDRVDTFSPPLPDAATEREPTFGMD